MRIRLGFLAMTLALLAGCSDESPDASSRAAGDGNKTQNSDNNAQGTPTAEPGSSTSGLSEGQSYFNNTVLPLVQECKSCHVELPAQVTTRGPTSIYVYASMRTQLAAAQGSDASDISATSNALYAKVRSRIYHTGGDLCPEGVSAALCDALFQWWTKEFPDRNPGPHDDSADGSSSGGGAGIGEPGGLVGSVDAVSAKGAVAGWAAHEGELTAAVTLTFYSGGPAGSGVQVGTTTANVASYDAGHSGNHAFNFTLPAAQCDGTVRRLYVYASHGSESVLITPDGKEFVAFSPKAAGQSFYTSNILPIVTTRCVSCHSTPNYNSQWNVLVKPTPLLSGGSRSNNTLYQKISGSVSHGGSNQCADAPTLCGFVQQWWDLEFGN